MRKAPLVLTAIFASLVLGGNAAWADDDGEDKQSCKRNQVTRWFDVQQLTMSHGEYSLLIDPATGAPVLETDLITCTPNPVFQVRGTFDYFAGICDDLAGPECGDNLIYVSEFCFGPTEGQLVGRIRSDFGRRPVRICYDPTFTGQCTTENQVAIGFVTSQNQGFIPDGLETSPVVGPAREIGVRTITWSRRFWFNGEFERIPRIGSQVNVLFDLPGIEPGGCDAVLAPCGFAESGVAARR
ncbi:MAG: hypothetical protein QNI99_22010 [Woeseiaceae bacterium]|nr:hypothetical protein [Woeseiaceae bacterium]